MRQPLSPTINVPGPGSYGLKSQIGEGPKVGLTGRNKVSSSVDSPGPGAYEAKMTTLKSPPKPTLKSGDSRMFRDPSTQKDNPGPGNYQMRSTLYGPKYGFGKSQRVGGISSITPGPGAYRVPCTIQAEPNYLLPNRSVEFKFV